MISFIISTLALFSFTFSATTQNIERAFLQNNSKLLYELLSAQNPINVSLPEPISFSDQLSNQQAYFVFKNIFSAYSTFEFYSERQTQSSANSRHIYQARWSFRDKKNNDQYLFYIFFYLIEDTSEGTSSRNTRWKITEIKAKKI